MTDQTFSTPLAALDAVVLDTETTGLDARVARIVQIGAVGMRGARIDTDRIFDRLVNPGVPIPPATTAIHGIADADVRDAASFADMLPDFDAFVGNAIVIGHTIGYDLTIIDREAKLAGREFRSRRSLDVRTLAELAYPSLAQYDIDRIAANLGIAVEARHTAIGDALTTARLFAALLPVLRQRNIRTLADAEAASRALADRQAGASRLPLTAPVPAATALPALARIDSFSFTHRVADVMSAPAIWVEPATPVRQVVAQLLSARISSVLVRTDDGTVGIATERDILRAIDNPNGGLEAPIAQFVSKPLQSISREDYVYRAIGRMERLAVRHLGVTDADGAVVGLLTTRNLLKQRASTAIVLGDVIDRAESEEELGKAWASMPLVARALLAEEVPARRVAAVISGEICALTRRVAELTEARLRAAGKGPPPVPYALLVLGSAGRGESLLAADQDNALVYADGEPGGAADRWFEEFATEVAASLDAIGIPLCKGGVMAKNALWRHSLDGWKALIESWVRRQRPQDILNVDIFFDGVPVHGNLALGEQVFSHALAAASQTVTFQVQLTENARQWHAPLTLLGGLKTDGDGRLDLKKFGIMPIFTAARVLAIRHRLATRSTPERLAGVAALGIGSPSEIEQLIDAHGVIMGAMMGQQLIDAEQGVPLSPRVDVKRLGADERTALKDALKTVAVAIDLIAEGRR